MDTTERLLAVLGLLQQRPTWSAEELADRLDVTTRTVRRDVSRLRDYGYPVESFAGRGGGYQLGAGAHLPLLLLDDDEALAVTLGLGLVNHAAVADLADGALSAQAKLERLLPSRLRTRLDDLDAVTMADPDDSSMAVDRVTFATLARAASTATAVRFGYVDQGDAPSERRVEPVRLVHARRRWYLVGFDRDRDDWRTFRVDRISAVTAGDRFPARGGPDPTHLVTGSDAHRYAHQAVVAVDTTPEEARRWLDPAIASVGGAGPPALLHIGTDDLTWLAGYLLGLPWSFEAIEPAELRAEIHRLAASIAERHRGP